MMQDAGARLLVTQAPLAHRVGPHALPVIALDADQAAIARNPASQPAHILDPQNPAYVIYTSGSTGKPKGVVVTNQNVTRLFSITQELFSFSPKDVWTMFHSFAFDFSVWEIWGAFLHGGRLVVVPYAVTRSPLEFFRLIVREGATILNQTPSAFYQLMQIEPSDDCLEQDLRLRRVIFGGEA